MRIAFFGTPRFAADILADIAGMVDVVCVYTRPDRIRSRGKQLEPSPVKVVAEALGIPVRTPAILRDADVIADLVALDLDLICVAAYGAILPKDVLDAPMHGCINVHASLLPRHRGAAPIERAILEGDEEAGVCIMRMEEGLDTGDYCIRRAIPIADLTTEELSSELAALGSSALLSAIAQIEAGGAKWTPQDDEAATYAQKIAKGELDADPLASALDNLRRIRASSAAHPSRARIAGRDATLLRAAAVADSVSLGALGAGEAIVLGKRLYLGCSDGPIELLELKPAGKGAMAASAFAAGNRELAAGAPCAWGRI